MSTKIASRTLPSIFDPDSDEEPEYDESYKKYAEDDTGPSLLPLQEAVSGIPKSFQQFLDILLPRIRPQSEIKNLSLEDQQSFVNIVCGEVANVFSSLQQQPADPFLSPSENVELHRRLFVAVLSIAEEMFAIYLGKATRLVNEGALFSVTANLSRLRGQLSIQLNKSFDIGLLRRKIQEELQSRFSMKRSQVGGQSGLKKPSQTNISPTSKLQKAINTKLLPGDIRYQIAKLEKAVKSLDPSLQDHKSLELQSKGHSSVTLATTATRNDNVLNSSEDSEGEIPTSDIKAVGRCSSQPDIYADFLLADLRLQVKKRRSGKGLTKEEKWKCVRRWPSMDSVIDPRSFDTESQNGNQITLGYCTTEQLQQDLQDLVKRTTASGSGNSKNEHIPDELPPLLLAQGHGLSDRKAKELKKYFKRKDEEVKHKQSTMEVHVIPEITAIPPSVELSTRASVVSEIEKPPATNSLYMPSHLSMGPASRPSQTFGMGSHLSGGFPQLSTSYAQMQDDEISLVTGVHSSEEQYISEDSNLHMDQLSGLGEESDESSTQPPVMKVSSERMEGMSWADFTASQVTNCEFSAISNNLVETEKPLTGNPLIPELQPDTIAIQLPSNQTAVMSDLRVPERSLWETVNLQLCEETFNHLTGDLGTEEVTLLDQVVKSEEKVQQVYREMMDTLPQSYLNFDEDPVIDSCIGSKENTDLKNHFASSTLSHRKSCRVVNPSLHQSVTPPWHEEDKKKWLSVNECPGLTPEQMKHRFGPDALSNPNLATYLRQYQTWLAWWKSTISTADFYRFLMKKQTDYLGLIYHLYNSDSDSEIEEIEERKRQEKAIKRRKLKEHMAKLKRLQQEKHAYKKGVWNTKTVTMGGLGQSPVLPDEQHNKSSSNHMPSYKDKSEMNTSIQSRLESVWQRLQYPDSAKIDMAVRYSREEFTYNMDEVLQVWENACQAIEYREEQLRQLESFEDCASKPSRFFEKGHIGSLRLQEARKRAHLLQKLDDASKRVLNYLDQLKRKYNDTLMYKGQPYCNKIKGDKTEMLYSLQQQRREEKLQLKHSFVQLG